MAGDIDMADDRGIGKEREINDYPFAFLGEGGADLDVLVGGGIAVVAADVDVAAT